MAWTYTGEVVPVADIHDYGSEWDTYAPGVGAGEAQWVQDWLARARLDFAREAAKRPAISTLSWSADNGAGDGSGIGTFTLVIVTA